MTSSITTALSSRIPREELQEAARLARFSKKDLPNRLDFFDLPNELVVEVLSQWVSPSDALGVMRAARLSSVAFEELQNNLYRNCIPQWWAHNIVLTNEPSICFPSISQAQRAALDARIIGPVRPKESHFRMESFLLQSIEEGRLDWTKHIVNNQPISYELYVAAVLKALDNKRLKIIEWLLNSHPSFAGRLAKDTDFVDNIAEEDTPLFIACGYRNLAKHLLYAKGNYDEESHYVTALWSAFRHGLLNIALQLLQSKYLTDECCMQAIFSNETYAQIDRLNTRANSDNLLSLHDQIDRLNTRANSDNLLSLHDQIDRFAAFVFQHRTNFPDFFVTKVIQSFKTMDDELDSEPAFFLTCWRIIRQWERKNNLTILLPRGTEWSELTRNNIIFQAGGVSPVLAFEMSMRWSLHSENDLYDFFNSALYSENVLFIILKMISFLPQDQINRLMTHYQTSALNTEQPWIAELMRSKITEDKVSSEPIVDADRPVEDTPNPEFTECKLMAQEDINVSPQISPSLSNQPTPIDLSQAPRTCGQAIVETMSMILSAFTSLIAYCWIKITGQSP